MNSFDVYQRQFDRKTGEKLDYKRVACVTGDDINEDDVWRLTNTIEEVWWCNEECAPIWENFIQSDGHMGCRSSMVGDVFHDLDKDEWIEVAPFGFEQAQPIEV